MTVEKRDNCQMICSFPIKYTRPVVKRLLEFETLTFLHYISRAIWILIMIATSVCCTVVYFDLAELYYTQRMQTTVADSVHPIFVVPFPSVGICLRNRIDWTRLHNQAAKRFLPPNVDNDTLHTFYRFFESLNDVKFYYFSRFSTLFQPSANVNLSLIDGINVLEVMKYLTFPCSQVFSTTCLWRLKPYNCCELFTLERTELGFCYVFNSVISPKSKEKAKTNPFYPYHNSYSGEGTGLDVEVLLDGAKTKPRSRTINGIYVMIKHPEQWHSDVKFINYNTFTKLGLTSQLTELDNRVRQITPVERGCLFDDEDTHYLYKKIPGLVYWRGNCHSRCHQEYVLKYCKCNLNILFPDDKSDIFSRETHIFENKYIDDVDNESMKCNCLKSCTQLLYHAFYSSFPLEGVDASDPIKVVHLDIHFQAAYLLKYRTAMRYTFVELLANFGGIIGLFLGASLLSAIELVYHFTLGEMIWHTDFKASVSHKNSSSLKKPPQLAAPEKRDQKLQQENKKFKDLLKAYWQKYCEKSTIHGVRYIYDPTMRGIERLIWSALVITCVTLACISYLILAERYSAQKLQTVVENSQFPVFQIPFPAVAICTHNRVNWEKFEAAKAEFLPPSADKALVEVFTNFVERMETLRFGKFNTFEDMQDINLEALDSIDVTKLAKFLAIRCEDIMVNETCYWRKMRFQCCSRFIMERTEYGMCLVFNSELSKESEVIQKYLGKQFYPYHTSRAGQNTGLNFRLKINSKHKRPASKASDTITILIKRPDQLSNTGYTITPETETYFIVRPEITDSDEDLHAISPLKRNCYFDDENFLLKYKTNMSSKWMLNNCLNRCHEEHVRKYCNCTLSLFFLFADDTDEQCRPSHFRCLAKNNDIFSYDKRKEEDAYFSAAKPGMTCSCLIPCNSVEYFTSITTLPLSDEITNDTSVKVYKVDVHYQSEVLIQYRTSMEFTSIDLIANFGGIFGLCLGASLVSAVELLYYATFGFGLYLYDNNYFTILKQNLRNLRQIWTIGFQNSFKEEYDQSSTGKTAFPPKHPQHKNNPSSSSTTAACPETVLPQQESISTTPHCNRCKDKGVNYYLTNNNSPKAKLLRVLIVAFATICTIYVCLLSSRRYFNSWVQTVIERTDVHVSEIPFPAVTICPVRGINLMRMQNNTRSFDTPSLGSKKEIQEFRLLLHAFNDVLWSPLLDYDNEFDVFDLKHNKSHHHIQAQRHDDNRSLKKAKFLEYLSAKEEPHPFSLFDLGSLLFYVTFECEDVFAECTWRRSKISCCNIFRKIETYKGICYSFNSMHVQEPIPTWPWVVSDSGLQTGLRVLIKRGAIANYYEKVAAMVHDPEEIGTSDIIYLNSESVVITVNPLRFTADYDIHSVKPELRHCYFTSFNMYAKLSNCNCTYLLPMAVRSSSNRRSLPMCGVSHLKCIYKHRSALLTTGNFLGENIDDVEFNTMDCKCYPNCNYIQYRTMVNTDNTGETHGKNYIDLQVQYQQDTLFSYRSTLCFNLLDLIVSYGGIAGLFLGLSLVGIIELLHDFIVCWKRRKEIKRLQTHVQQYDNKNKNNNNSEDDETQKRDTSAEYVVKTRENLLQYRNECVTELQIPEAQVEQYKKWQYPNDATTQCYLKCVFSKFGLFDTTSGFNVENIHQQLLGSHAEANHDDVLHAKIASCVDKNEQGSNACEWAYRGATCFIKNNLQLVKQSVAQA
ncbi:Pickpocket protein 19 [Lucilia cuprina]|nr:Pickpocket protein 19 [Lucilia cuprina]